MASDRIYCEILRRAGEVVGPNRLDRLIEVVTAAVFALIVIYLLR